MLDSDLGELVPRALDGDQLAWNALVGALSTVALRVARTHRLGEADAWDVCQNTWLALAEQLGALRDITHLPGWLATTARRQALRLRATGSREVVMSCEPEPRHSSPELLVLSTERDRALWNAVDRLPGRYRRLLLLLAYSPELTYREIATELGISPGSVGPLRRRCCDRLRRRLLADGFDYP